jgi:1,4-dihydroxy-2-naphthoyl-CoA hydrolase
MDQPVEGYPVPGTLDDSLGFELLEAGPDRVRGRFSADRRVQQPFGLVHGGAYMAFAESLASVATFAAVAEDGNIAVGQANDNHFLRPVTDGLVHAEGAPIHRGRTSWVWDIRFTDDRGRLCAMSRVTIAVRPRDTR